MGRGVVSRQRTFGDSRTAMRFPLGLRDAVILLAFSTAAGAESLARATCVAVRPPADDNWCNNNCNNVPPNCPSSLCSCGVYYSVVEEGSCFSLDDDDADDADDGSGVAAGRRRAFVNDVETCTQAAVDLLPERYVTPDGVSIFEQSGGLLSRISVKSNRPPGCLVMTDWTNSLGLNLETHASGACSASRKCICANNLDECANAAGMLENTRACRCGIFACTPGSGLFCTKKISHCSKGPWCSAQTQQTHDVCACGAAALINDSLPAESTSLLDPDIPVQYPAVVCARRPTSVATGMSCYEYAVPQTLNGPDQTMFGCRPAVASEAGRVKTALAYYSGVGSVRENNRGTSQSCANQQGTRGLVVDLISCLEGARSLGWFGPANAGHLVKEMEAGSGGPSGCSLLVKGSEKTRYVTGVKYSADPTAASNACGSDWGGSVVHCICFSAPRCTVTDGTANNNGPCICGNVACTGLHTTGLRCSEKKWSGDDVPARTGVCSMDPCQDTTGLVRNAAPGCTCGAGTTQCSRRTGGLYCVLQDLVPSNAAESAECLPCQSNCDQCQTEDAIDTHDYVDTCLRCALPYYLVNGTCVVTCPEGMYPDLSGGRGVCMSCHASCLACHLDKGDQICSACARGFFLTVAGKCAKLCGDGYFPDAAARKCQRCADHDCAQCAKSNSTCSVCGNEKYLMEDACLDACPSGHFGRGEGSLGRVCERCSEECSDCALINSEETCTGCVDGYYLYQGTNPNKCVTACPADFYGLSSARSCVACPDAPKNSTTCPGCPPGKWGSMSDPGGCTNCSAGFFAGGGDKENCISCPRGYHGRLSGTEVLSSCIPCRAGTWDGDTDGGAVDATTCRVCPEGKYGEVQGMTSDHDACKMCAQGYYNKLRGSNSRFACLACASGRWSDNAGRADDCTTCIPGKYQPAQASTNECSSCPEGYAQIAEGRASCDACIPGHYASLPNRESCRKCEEGRFARPSASTKCSLCPSGFSNAKEGQGACVPCYPGKFSITDGARSCEQCPRNHKMPDPMSNVSCQVCPNGWFNDVLGSIACTRIPPGSFLGGVEKTLAFCQPGFKCPGGENESAPCPIGRFAGDRGSRVCQKCIPGQFSNGEAATGCESCPRGWLQQNDGASSCLKPQQGRIAVGGTSSVPISEGWKVTDCVGAGDTCLSTEPCPAGKRGWKDSDTGLLGFGCKDCEAGFWSKSGGMKCYKCEKGKFSASPTSAQCEACNETNNEYSDEESATECKTCPPGDISTGKMCFHKCSPGQYVDDKDRSCRPCPAGAECDGGSPVVPGSVRAKFGWDRCKAGRNGSKIAGNGEAALRFERCQFPAACLGATNDALRGKFEDSEKRDMATTKDYPSYRIERCFSEFGYVNGSRLCHACGTNFSKKGVTGQCFMCPAQRDNMAISIAGAAAGVVGLIGYVAITISDHGSKDAAEGTKSIMLSFVQMTMLLTTFPIAWPAIFSHIFQVGGAITALGEHFVDLKCMFPSNTEADIFYMKNMFWALLPPALCLSCAVLWLIFEKICGCYALTHRKGNRSTRRPELSSSSASKDVPAIANRISVDTSTEDAAAAAVAVSAAAESKGNMPGSGGIAEHGVEMVGRRFTPTTPRSTDSSLASEPSLVTNGSFEPAAAESTTMAAKLKSAANVMSSSIDAKMRSAANVMGNEIEEGRNTVTSVVALMYLIWPQSLVVALSIFACRDICGEGTFLLADLDVRCDGPRHRMHKFMVGWPMIVAYVIGFPAMCLLGIWRAKAAARRKGVEMSQLKQHKTWGMFYSSFRPQTWWWEGTIALRKISIAMIGVFGTSMGQMQVHSCLLLLIIVLLVTLLKSPYGGDSAHLLTVFEITSLCATIFMLWGASVFNTYPRCEAGDGTGKTLVWCDFIAVLSGAFVIVVALALILFIIMFKVINPMADGLQKSGKLMRQWQSSRISRLARFVHGSHVPTVRKVPSAAHCTIQEEMAHYRASIDASITAIPGTGAAIGRRSRGLRKKTVKKRDSVFTTSENHPVLSL